MKIEIGGGNFLISLLTVLFVGLKLCKVIAWSWLWVLSPLWMPLCIVLPAMSVLWVSIKTIQFFEGKRNG